MTNAQFKVVANLFLERHNFNHDSKYTIHTLVAPVPMTDAQFKVVAYTFFE